MIYDLDLRFFQLVPLIILALFVSEFQIWPEAIERAIMRFLSWGRTKP